VTNSDLLDLPITTLSGEATILGNVTGGRAALVVNVASRCGLTPQYATLEQLHEEFADRGFTVIGFPSNQFGGQEPGTSDEIAAFCSDSYGVTFPMSAKIDVNGADRDPIYAALIGDGPDIQWNFEKFLVAPDGSVAARFSPQTAPDAAEIRTAIQALLEEVRRTA
jgi:glutathione peroxidase